MTEDSARLEGGSTFVHMEVRATNICRGNSNEGISWPLDLRIWDVLDADVTRPVVDDSFHLGSPSQFKGAPVALSFLPWFVSRATRVVQET